jgi:hypothetical protein
MWKSIFQHRNSPSRTNSAGAMSACCEPIQSAGFDPVLMLNLSRNGAFNPIDATSREDGLIRTRKNPVVDRRTLSRRWSDTAIIPSRQMMGGRRMRMAQRDLPIRSSPG